MNKNLNEPLGLSRFIWLGAVMVAAFCAGCSKSSSTDQVDSKSGAAQSPVITVVETSAAEAPSVASSDSTTTTKTLLVTNSPAPSAASAKSAPDKLRSNTRDMVEALAVMAKNSDENPHYYSNARRVDKIKAQLKEGMDLGKFATLLGDLAEQQMNAGQTEESIETLEELEATMKKAQPAVYAEMKSFLLNKKAIAYIRLGEQQNCVAHNNIESCLLPIAPGAVHTEPFGSKSAQDVLAGVLNVNPEMVPAQWLLNVAAMTLGTYPEAVPEKWRIPPSRFESDYDIGRFDNVASRTELGIHTLAGSVIADDFNRDGLIDLMISSWGYRSPLKLFMNRADGSFADASEKAGLLGLNGGLNMVQADFNNDGHVDVLILRGAWFADYGEIPNSLLRNNGDGTFDDVTVSAGVLSKRPTQAATWLDYDNDGWLDLFVANESTDPTVHPCELFHNNGDGTFVNVARECGLDKIGYFKGVTSGDIDNDGDPEIFLSQLIGDNILLRNDGPDPDAPKGSGIWKFSNQADALGVKAPIFSFPTWFWDYDNDGWLDLYVADYDNGNMADVPLDYLGREIKGEGPRLYRNRGDGKFENVTKSVNLHRPNLAMGVNFGDLDNDGWLDFYLGTGSPDLSAIFPNLMFRNAGGKTFQDVTFSGGFGHLQKGHGIAFADLDNDGDQDVYAVMGGAYSGDGFFNALFQNPGHKNNWLKLKLEGDQSNRSAIGARIAVTVGTPNGSRTIHRTVSSGGSFGGNPLQQHIGIGDATEIRKVEISWPTSGLTQLFENVPSRASYLIREGQKDLATLPHKTFVLGKSVSQGE